MKVTDDDYICGTCKWFAARVIGDVERYYCGESKEEEPCDPRATCDDWTDPEVVEPTEDEKRANAGCDEAHRIMVEGREIE